MTTDDIIDLPDDIFAVYYELIVTPPHDEWHEETLLGFEYQDEMIQREDVNHGR